MARTEPALPLGRREANKLEKLARIRGASRTVFLSKGYEVATMREIANAADVAFGTLFLYAKNKQDLLLLVFEEEFVALADRASRGVDRDAPVLDQIIGFFEGFYDFFTSMPGLSRDMLREVTFNTGGIVAPRIWAGLADIQHHLARLVARAQAEGRVSPHVSPNLAAQVIFSLHRIEIRSCLDADVPDVASSLRHLREQCNVVMAGLKPR